MLALLVARYARWLSWFLAAVNIILMGIGLALQTITKSPTFGIPLLIHFSEAFALGWFAVIGALIVSRHPRHPIGWIWLLISMSFGSDHFAWGYASYGYIAKPGSLPGVEGMIVWLYLLGRGTFGTLGIVLLLLLFPNGRPLTRRWGVLAWITVGIVAASIPFSVYAPSPPGYFPFPTDLIAAEQARPAYLSLYEELAPPLVVACLVAAGISLFLRMLRARGEELQQIKWFVYATAFLLPAFFLIGLGGLRQADNPNPLVLIGPILGVTASIGMAVASSFAIFRYRLWDIDIIIRRTLIFGFLTGALALVYFSSVLLFGYLFRFFTGQNSTLATVSSTLTIAALFSPLRYRIQDFIDRLFYRRKYDAQKSLAGFAALTRDQIDLNELTNALLRNVQETVQPEHVSLWLKE